MEKPLTGKEAREFFEGAKRQRGSTAKEATERLEGYKQEIKKKQPE
jgi:hypothetical protein